MTNSSKDINFYRRICFLSDSDEKTYKAVLNSIIFEFIYDNENKPVSVADSKKHILDKFKLNINIEELEQIIQKNSSYVLHHNTEPLKIELKEEKIKEIKHKLSENPIDTQINNFLKKNNHPTNYSIKIKDLLEQTIFENISSLSKHERFSDVLKQSQTLKQSNLFNIYNQFLDQCDSDSINSIMDLFVKATEFAILTSGRGVSEITKDIFKGKTYLLDTNAILMLLGIGGNKIKDSISHTISKACYQGIKFQYTLDTEREFNRRVDAFAQDLQNIKNFDIIKNQQKETPYLDHGFLKLYCKMHDHLSGADPLKNFIKKLKNEMRNLRQSLNITPYNGDVSADENSKDFLELEDQIVSHKKNNNNNTKSINSIERAAKVDAKNITLVRKLRGNNNYNYSNIKSFYLTRDLTLNTLLKNLNYDKETMIETFTPTQLFLCHNSLSTEHEKEDYKTFKIYLKRKNISESLSRGREIFQVVREAEKYTENPEVIKDILKDQVNEKAKDPQKYNHKSTIQSIPKKVENIQKKHELDSRKYSTALMNAEKLFPKHLNCSKILVRFIDIFFCLAPTILLYWSTKNNLSVIIILLCLILDYFFNKIFKWHKNLVKFIFKKKIENSPYSQVYKDNNDYIEKSNSFFEKNFIKLWSN
ncbi:MAG: hypothetical protein P8I61_04460 [Opitutae bacterium]|nr:hypothetical protein [Opitutae bacterium]